MTAAELLQNIRQAGFTLKCEGDTILVKPAGRLPQALREAVKTHRHAILGLLRQTPVSVPVPPLALPARARLFFSDSKGRPCSPDNAFLWCWEGAPCWLYVREHPPPGSATESMTVSAVGDEIVNEAKVGRT